ncbi:type II toxin-antitoxin system VapC family toxin [Agromyces sp. S2-1-8]|uniref:type II toxin-antitoxin system VapC family toxin n=1 Tax=Agromyces sp. S2-1-8 TaxID=2897180 RepID=UPI001E55D195|nr:hypothetical protein [Agromyces sp. S2-1-8]MCD5346555.1 hypothetical protein [Agromyces sp. S2-1-8]
MGDPETTRYAIDAVTALRLIRDGRNAEATHPFVAPSLIRSHAMSLLYREVRDGRLDERDARTALEGLASLRMRLLGDRVSRATAWRLARQLDLEDPSLAEYLAVATLQADVLVAGDERVAAAASGIVPLATYDTLGVTRIE